MENALTNAWKGFRMRTGGAFLDVTLNAIARMAKLHPFARATRKDVQVQRNIAYGPGGKRHRLDVYAPKEVREGNPQGNPNGLPVVIYIHGGGFRILSKDTHWMMGLAFASRGYLVFNINYRLAPKNPFPAALEDAALAYQWVQEHAAEYGGDASHILLAGESAGANLATSLTIASTFPRDEAWAQTVFETGVVPKAVMPACGILQVSDPGRFRRRKPAMKSWLNDRITQVSSNYLAQPAEAICEGDFGLADPLVFLEQGHTPTRPLPPFFLICGTKDPILDDTRRLHAALVEKKVDAEMKIYPGGIHAFHALLWKDDARACWRDHFEFLSARSL
jgi:acetyl esterase